MLKTDIVQKTIVLDPEGRVLLLRRSETDTRRPNQWDFPGGELDPGESLEQGAVREVLEETGLIISSPKLFYSKTEVSKWLNDKEERVSNVVRMYYIAKVKSTEVILSYEHSEFCWVSMEEALKRLEYFRHKDVIKYILDNKLDL